MSQCAISRSSLSPSQLVSADGQIANIEKPDSARKARGDSECFSRITVELMRRRWHLSRNQTAKSSTCTLAYPKSTAFPPDK